MATAQPAVKLTYEDYCAAPADNRVDEADDAVTAAMVAGDGYTVAAAPADSASVTVKDDDGQPPPETPEVSFASASSAPRRARARRT